MAMNNGRITLQRVCLILLLAVVTAAVLEAGIFMREQQVQTEGTLVSLLHDNSVNIIGYEVQENRYKKITSDPQIIISDVNTSVNSVLLEFSERIYSDVAIQVFYSEEGMAFSEDKSVKVETGFYPTRYVAVALPETEVSALRIDIDDSFSLGDISISDVPIQIGYPVVNSFDYLHVTVMALLIATVLGLLTFWFSEKRNDRRLSELELLFCIFCFIYYFLWAVSKPHNYAPDEAMRYDLTRFLFENDRLPIGEELLSPWGFSYAHYPTVLCHLIGYIFVKVASIFTGSEFLLLVSARMVSVCCATGSVYFVIKAAKQMFEPLVKWIMVILVAMMPQFAFLASYVNNDIVAFFGITMILYSWILGIKDKWNLGNTTLLSVGISTCGLAYYNGYAWILASIFFFYISYFNQRPRDYRNAKRYTLYIVALVFLMIGYFFIRHLVLYQDLLGFKMIEYYGERYAIESLKPSTRVSLAEAGVPVLTMLFGSQYRWLKSTWLSSIGVFGYMEFMCPNEVYVFVTIIVFGGVIGAIMKGIHVIIVEKKRCDVIQSTFYWCIGLSAVITVALSVYHSHFFGFQAQGRYCYPAFPAIAVFVAKGYEYWLQKIEKKENKYAIWASLCTLFVVMSFVVYKMVYLPS